MECDICGKEMEYVELKTIVLNNTEMELCPRCYNEKHKDLKEENEKKKTKKIRNVVGNSELSIPELQLKELMEMKAEIVKIKGDLHTISNIILFWFIIGLIGFLISIFSFLALSGSL